MKKIFLSLVAVLSAVTLMAQQPTACDAQLQFKFCFNTSANLDSAIYANALPFTWNGQNFPADGTYPMQKSTTILNYRGCDSTITMTVSVQFPPKGSAGGNNAKPFSVSATKQVFFSQGNLQYQASADGSGTDLITQTATGTQYGRFRFAEHQYDWVTPCDTVNANIKGTVKYKDGTAMRTCTNDPTQRWGKNQNWIDLFGYGTSGYNEDFSKTYVIYPYQVYSNNGKMGHLRHWAYWQRTTIPIYASCNKVPGNIANTNFDWGVYNDIIISNTDTAQHGTWRTLTSDEWIYLLSDRTNASSKYARVTLYAKNTSENPIAKGIILLPDDWVLPDGVTVNTGGVSSTTKQNGKLEISQTAAAQAWTYNQYTLAQWAILEAAGAVFLPANQKIECTNNTFTNFSGYYWTSTSTSFDTDYWYPHELSINQSNPKSIAVKDGDSDESKSYGYRGRCVRLVTDK